MLLPRSSWVWQRVAVASTRVPWKNTTRFSGRKASTTTATPTTSSSITPNLTLYQYAICPFCNLVKAVLHYGQIPYQAVEVNPLTKAELVFSPEYRKVPIMTITTTDQVVKDEHGELQQWNGSEEIVPHLLPLLDHQNNKTPPLDATSPSSQRQLTMARDDLAPLLYPNLCATLPRSFQAFSYIHSQPNFSTFQKYSIQTVGSVAMYMAARKIKKKRNITDERAALYALLNTLEDSLLESSTNTSTTTTNNTNSPTPPNLGDLATYGMLRGLEGLDIHTEIMQEYPHIHQWYQHLRTTVVLEDPSAWKKE